MLDHKTKKRGHHMKAQFFAAVFFGLVSNAAFAQCDMNDKSCFPAQEAPRTELAQCDINDKSCFPAQIEVLDLLACNDPSCMVKKVEQPSDLLACDNPSCQRPAQMLV
jgi:hypothetical protein